MTTLVRPSGTVVIHPGFRLSVCGDGKVTCVYPLQDYIPPNESFLVLWMDSGEIEEHGTTIRGNFSDPPTHDAARAASPVGLIVRRRVVPTALTCALLPENESTPVMFVPSGEVFSFNYQNGRKVLSLGPTSNGIVGTWGPFALSGNWTLGLFLRTERMVSDWAGWLGAGPMTLLSCPAANLSINLPSGGAVPPEALRSAGGPLDGIAAGVPWDAAFLLQWRFLCVQNNAQTGIRRISVDGVTIGTVAASVGSVPTNSTYTVGPKCPASIAEVLTWDYVVSDTSVIATVKALRCKWGVTALADPPPTGGVQSIAALQTILTLKNMAPSTLPSSVPVPAVWMDAAYGATLWSDADGLVPVLPGGRVRRWMDRSGNGNHISFPENTTEWLTGATDQQNNKPLLGSLGTGTWSSNPLAGATAYTVIAVWRTTTEGAPPLSVNGLGVFNPNEWRESIGVDAEYKSLPAPNTLGATNNSVVVGSWEGDTNTGALRWRLFAVEDSTGGFVCTGTDATGSDWLTHSLTVGKQNLRLQIGELLVWRSRLTPSQSALLATYIRDKWGAALLPISGVVTQALGSLAPAPVQVYPIPTKHSEQVMLYGSRYWWTSQHPSLAAIQVVSNLYWIWAGSFNFIAGNPGGVKGSGDLTKTYTNNTGVAFQAYLIRT